MNSKVSVTFNNQEGMATKYDWLVIGLFSIIHLNALYWATQFIWSALYNDGGCYEGLIILKTVIWIMIYVVCILLGLLITGFPAVADWANNKQKNMRWKIRLY